MPCGVSLGWEVSLCSIKRLFSRIISEVHYKLFVLFISYLFVLFIYRKIKLIP
jgi:hypothetical protein